MVAKAEPGAPAHFTRGTPYANTRSAHVRRYRETFQVSLLGLPGSPATEQVLVGGPGTVLVPLVIQRPLGVVFEERRLALNAAPACVVDEVVPGRCAAVPVPLRVRF